MKNKRMLWGLVPLLIMSLLLGACTAPDAEAANNTDITTDTTQPGDNPGVPRYDNPDVTVQLEVTYDEFLEHKNIERGITVERPGSVIITLGANASTGYAWREATIGNTALVSAFSRQYVEPTTGLLGAAGKDVFVFKSLQPGTTAVTFNYVSPAGQVEWTLTVDVTVK